MHIHSCLSPCADLMMVPQEILKKAAEKDIKMLAICDHNSCENAASFMAAGKEQKIAVLPGMEVCTREEAHILALFGDLASALELQKIVYENLEGINDEKTFGIQVIVNKEGEPLGINERLLIGSTNLPVEEVVDTIHSLGGLAIASHINREAFSIVGQLGFIPDSMKLDAVELSKHIGKEEYPKWKEEYKDFPIVRFSDAHFPDEIGEAVTTFQTEESDFEELKRALRQEGGRAIVDWQA